MSLQCSGFPHANTKRAGLRRPQQNSIFTQLIPPVIFFGFCVKSFEFSEKCSINKCIVRVTLRSGYSNNSLNFQKKGNCSRPHYWWAFNSFCTLGLFSFRHSSDFFYLCPQGASWSIPGENSLTLFTLLSAMQILLIWEALADLSNMIIVPLSPLKA